MTQLTKEFQENKKEQHQIASAVLSAIPENVYYHNLIIAFAELLADFTLRAFKEVVYSKSTKPESKLKEARK